MYILELPMMTAITKHKIKDIFGPLNPKSRVLNAMPRQVSSNIVVKIKFEKYNY